MGRRHQYFADPQRQEPRCEGRARPDHLHVPFAEEDRDEGRRSGGRKDDLDLHYFAREVGRGAHRLTLAAQIRERAPGGARPRWRSAELASKTFAPTYGGKLP